MPSYSFITRMPDAPGALHRAAKIIKKYNGNINRIQFDRRIDPGIVFFDITAEEVAYTHILRDLGEIGYLQTSLSPLSFLKFCVYLPNHQPGTLFEFLNFITAAGANIAYIDFDDRGRNPDRLTVSLNLEQSGAVDTLLNQLKSRYRLEILEYDTTGKSLDSTVFYVRFAQQIRELIGETEEAFILSFLADTNHIAQELMDRGRDPRQAFDSVLLTGRTMRETTGLAFHAGVQKIRVSETAIIYCFQVPCGGNIFVIDSSSERVMIDTGYGIYHDDVRQMLRRYGLNDGRDFSRVIVTHADADHCGAAGFFSVPADLHKGTLAIIEKSNRAYGSRNEGSVLESFYTKMINLFSRFTPPRAVRCFQDPAGTKRGIFPVMEVIRACGLDLEVLEGLGGHTYGQIFLYSHEQGLLFTADSLINFGSLSREQAEYSSLAAFLITSVNVDSDLARAERTGLLALAREADARLAPMGKRCLIFGGHGAVSVIKGDGIEAYYPIEEYRAAGKQS